jgi:hypothetical protein
VLGGEVVERGQRLPVVIELRNRLRVLRAELLTEALERSLGVGAGWRLDDLVQHPLRPRLQPLRQAVKDVRCLVHPAALLPSLGEHVAQRRPGPERAVTDDELRTVQPAALEITQHARPGVGGLAVAVLDRQELLGAVLANADHDQQAQPVVLAQADRHVHAIDEQVRVPAEGQQPLAEPLVVGLPLLAQPADRRRRQPRGVLTEQTLKRRPEVARRQTSEVQDREHLGHLRRPARVRRQDLR